MKYRVITSNGHVEFANLNQDTIDFHIQNGIGEIIEIPEDIEYINKEDLHTQTYNKLWKLKGYIAGWEINHAVYCPDCVYKPEAEALINWYWNTWNTLESLGEITQEEFNQIIQQNINEIITQQDIDSIL